jgi:hypothetical protein
MTREFRLLASLLLNLVLIATVLALALRKSERAPAPSVREIASEKANTETPLALAQPKLPQYTGIASEPDRTRWLVDQLRTAGVPNDVVARFALAQIDDGWQQRFDQSASDSRGNPDAMVALHLEQEKDVETQMRARHWAKPVSSSGIRNACCAKRTSAKSN